MRGVISSTMGNSLNLIILQARLPIGLFDPVSSSEDFVPLNSLHQPLFSDIPQLYFPRR